MSAWSRPSRLLAETLARRRQRPCRCGHEAPAHEHYRRGTDCALCGCRRYVRTRG